MIVVSSSRALCSKNYLRRYLRTFEGSKVRSNIHTASRYPRFRPFPNETCDRSVRVYSHGFLFVLAVNRIACAGRACAGRAPVSSRAPRRVAMPTTWERTHHANPDARQRQHHTPTIRSLGPIIIITSKEI